MPERDRQCSVTGCTFWTMNDRRRCIVHAKAHQALWTQDRIMDDDFAGVLDPNDEERQPRHRAVTV